MKIACFHLRSLIASTLLFASASAALAQTVSWSNLGGAAIGNYGPYYSNSGGYATAFVQPFTTGAESTLLQSVTLISGNGSGTGFTLSLYSAASGQPALPLETLSGATAPTSGSYAFTSGAQTSLAPFTTYYLVGTVPSTPDTSFTFRTTSASNPGSDYGWTIVPGYWARQVNDGFGSPEITFGRAWAFSVTTTSAIPEPGTYAALAGAGVLGLALWRRRRAVV